jgi:type I restriction enzyme, S subunit
MTEWPDSTFLAEVVDAVSDTRSPQQVEPESLLVGVVDLEGMGELTDSPRLVSESKGKLARLHAFERGDLLVAATQSNKPKVWLADRAGYCTANLSVLRPNGRLDPRYLLWWLRARGLRAPGRRLELGSERVGRPSGDQSPELVVLLLDQLDALIALRRQALVATRRLAPAMLQERFGDPLGSAVWPTIKLGEVAKPEAGWSPKCADRPARRDEWGVIKVSAVSSGQFLPEENKALPRDMKPREELRLNAGDLLMVRSNTPSLVGTTAIVAENYPRLLLTDKVWRLRVAEPLDALFLKALLSHPAVREQLSGMATGNLASMQNLTMAKVRDLDIVWPPRSARAEHVADMALIDEAERAQLAQAAQLDELLNAVLGLAFAAGQAGTPAAVVIGRSLFRELSPLHQAIWKLLVSADKALTMPELSRRLRAEASPSPGIDRLRGALALLAAAGVATRVEDGHAHRWEEALPYEPAGVP